MYRNRSRTKVPCVCLFLFLFFEREMVRDGRASLSLAHQFGGGRKEVTKGGVVSCLGKGQCRSQPVHLCLVQVIGLGAEENASKTHTCVAFSSTLSLFGGAEQTVRGLVFIDASQLLLGLLLCRGNRVRSGTWAHARVCTLCHVSVSVPRVISVGDFSLGFD